MENDFDIKNLTSLKIGGKIKTIYFPTSVDEFIEILKSEPTAKVLGNMSNTLISSSGYNGVVICTTKMTNININEQTISAECGVKGPKLSQFAAENGLTGFEFMIGFPGSLGGNICMNASANKQCISDFITSIKCFENNTVIDYSKEDMNFAYRHSICQEKNLIILSATFDLQKKSKTEINKTMDEFLTFRKTHQPSLALPNCGSVFKNPENNSAGKLLDSVNAKNMRVGNAKVWENHANFIINENNATSLEILQLIKKMYDCVEAKYNIKLIPEVQFLSGNNKEEDELCKKLKIKLI